MKLRDFLMVYGERLDQVDFDVISDSSGRIIIYSGVANNDRLDLEKSNELFNLPIGYTRTHPEYYRYTKKDPDIVAISKNDFDTILKALDNIVGEDESLILDSKMGMENYDYPMKISLVYERLHDMKDHFIYNMNTKTYPIQIPKRIKSRERIESIGENDNMDFYKNISTFNRNGSIESNTTINIINDPDYPEKNYNSRIFNKILETNDKGLPIRAISNGKEFKYEYDDQDRWICKKMVDSDKTDFSLASHLSYEKIERVFLVTEDGDKQVFIHKYYPSIGNIETEIFINDRIDSVYRINNGEQIFKREYIYLENGLLGEIKEDRRINPADPMSNIYIHDKWRYVYDENYDLTKIIMYRNNKIINETNITYYED